MSMNAWVNWLATKTCRVTYSDNRAISIMSDEHENKAGAPLNIRLHQRSRRLEVEFADGSHFDLPCEYLRVYSPSADVKGHGPGQGTLQVGKEQVNITAIEPVGNYAVKLHFDDGHNTGLYSWQYLYELGRDYESNWQAYLEALEAAGHSRRETLAQTYKPQS